MEYLYPNALQPGDTVGFIAPSSPLQAGRFEQGVRYFQQKGLKVRAGHYLNHADRFLAGSDQERAADFMNFIQDPEIKAIVATAGGIGSQRILPLLNYDLIRKHPKIVIGFSDTTALQLGLLSKTGLITFSGFTLRDTDQNPVEPLVDQTLINALFGKPFSLNEGETLIAGEAQGRLIGGNLSLMSTLIGTPFMPDCTDAILLIEDVWREPFEIDSLLTHLDQSGIFAKAKGIIFGQFEQCVAKHHPDRDGTVDDVIHDWAQRFTVPCIKNFPYGHVNRRCILPIGKEITLNASNANVII